MCQLHHSKFQGVFEINKDTGMTLAEIGDGFTVDDVIKATGCQLNIAADLKPMRQA
jgi:3-oxoacid CoA-transferase